MTTTTNNQLKTTTIINVTQGTDEWLEWRSKGISATDIPIIMGLSPYKTPYRLWLEKTGRANADDLSNNPNVQRGNRLEPLARSYWEDKDSEILLPICAQYDPAPMLRASLDGLSMEGKPYELKAPHESTFSEIEEKGTDADAYKLYELQVKTQCVVVGSDSGKLCFYMEDERTMEFEIELQPEDLDNIVTAAIEFWNLIETDTPPALDPEKDFYIPQSGEDEFRWQSYSELFSENKAKIDALKAQIAPLENAQKELQEAMIQMMGDFQNADYGGLKVTRFERKGTIDYSKFIKTLEVDEQTLEGYRKKSSWQSRVTLSEKDKVINEEIIGNESSPTQAGYF